MSTNGIYQAHGVVKLGENVSATSAAMAWGGGAGMLSVEATWGGGTVKLQVQSANGTWIDVGPDTNLTANGVVGFILPASKAPTQDLPNGCGLIRISVTTATAVYAYAVGY